MPHESRIEFQAEIWLHPGKGGWHFITIPAPLARAIKAHFGQLDQGWGSLAVEARIGALRWKTSIFPDSKSGTYLLPVKAPVRKKGGFAAGDVVQVVVEVAPSRD